MGPPFWGDLGLEQSPCCSPWWLWMCSWPHCQGRGWRSQWEAAWDVLNCCKWDGACCALNHPVPPGWHCPGGLTTLGWHRVPSTRGHVPSARQGAPGMICGRDKELSASPGIGWDAPGPPGGLGICPCAPQQLPAPRQVQCTLSLQVFLPENCPFSHFWEAGQAGCARNLLLVSPLLSTAGLGALGPAGSRVWGWKGLRQAKENKSAAGPGWLTSQTTVFDSLLLPCQVQLLPHSHPLAGGARGDVGFLRSGGEGGCRGEQQWEGLALHCFFSALLSSVPLPGQGQEGAGGDAVTAGGDGARVTLASFWWSKPSARVKGGRGDGEGVKCTPRVSVLPSPAVCLQGQS